MVDRGTGELPPDGMAVFVTRGRNKERRRLHERETEELIRAGDPGKSAARMSELHVMGLGGASRTCQLSAVVTQSA